MLSMTNREKFAYWLFGDRIPLTKILLVSNAITYIAIVLFKISAIPAFLCFQSETVVNRPWTLLTYPAVGMSSGIICLLFACYWLWVAGGSLERSWGTKRFAGFFFVMSAISALGLLAAALVKGLSVTAAGLWLPLAGVTIAFGMLNPEEQILFCFIIPMKLKYLAILSAVGVLVGYGQTSIILGLFALAGCLFSYLYVRPGRWLSSGNRDNVIHIYKKPRLSTRLNPIRKMQDHKTQEWLKKQLDDGDYGEDRSEKK